MLTDLLSWMLLCAASVLFYGSDQPRGIARVRQLQAPVRRSAARWAGCLLVASAVGVELVGGTSVPVTALSVSLAFMVALTLVTLAFSIATPSSTPKPSSAVSARRSAAASTPRATSARRQISWRARADNTARALVAIVASLLAAFFCSAAFMRWLPGEPPTRFSLAMLLAIPLWVLGICVCLVAASTWRASLWSGAAGVGIAMLLRWLG